MERAIFIAIGLLALGVAGFPLALGVLPQAAAQSVAADAEMTTFAIENMTCALCPLTVRKAIEGVEGVQSVTVDFDAKTATVVFDPAVTTLDVIAASSTDAGYLAKAIG